MTSTAQGTQIRKNGSDKPYTAPKEQANLDFLLTLLRSRLGSRGLLKSVDEHGNIKHIETDIFEDEQLVAFLRMALSEFNAMPSTTHFTFADDRFIETFAEALVEGATVYALSSQALIERGREFEIVDGGVSFKSPKMSDLLNSQFEILIRYHTDKLREIKSKFKITDQTGKISGRHRYTTNKDHGKFPAGTECWAERIDDETVLFEYDDGTKMKLTGTWFLLGSEMPARVKEGQLIRTDEEVINENKGVSPFWLLAGTLLGGLLTTAMKPQEAVRVAEIEPIQGENDDREDRAASEDA